MNGTKRHQTAKEYHAAPGASASRLRKFEVSPAHMKWAMDHPAPPTPAMVIGSAVHTAVLEPDLLDQEWGRIPDGDGRSKAVKDAKAKLTELYGADRILKPEAFDTVIGMRDAVLGNELACQLLDNAETEASYYWTDAKSGVDCKARLDLIVGNPMLPRWERCVVDLKTTTDASPKEFQRSAYNMGYHLQMAHYLAASERERFVFIVVEREPPHCVAIYELDNDALALGEKDRAYLLHRWAMCEENEAVGFANPWPGFPVDVQELSLPRWAYTQ